MIKNFIASRLEGPESKPVQVLMLIAGLIVAVVCGMACVGIATVVVVLAWSVGYVCFGGVVGGILTLAAGIIVAAACGVVHYQDANSHIHA